MVHLLLPALLALATPQDSEKIRTIVDKAVAAHGGADKLLRLFRWKERYYLGDDPKGTVRQASLVPPEEWWAGPKNIAAGNADRSDKTYLVWVWTLVPLLEKDSKLALLPDLEVDGKPAVGLKLSRDGRKDISLYFDKDSGRLVRLDWRAYYVTFENWKEHDGARYAAKSVVHRKDGTVHLWTEFLELERLKAPPGR